MGSSALKEFVVQREHGALYPGQLGRGGGSDVAPTGGQIPQERCSLRAQVKCSSIRGTLGGGVEDGHSIPLCLGLSFP